MPHIQKEVHTEEWKSVVHLKKEGVCMSSVVGVEDEEADKYFLIRALGMKDHKCWASSHQVDIRAAKSQMYEMVAKEPTRSLLEIYEVVRQKYTAQMDPDSKLLFLQEFPSFLDLKSALLAQRRKFIPPDPKNMIEINIDLPVFLTEAGENVVKGDQLLEDGRRIILFTTKEHLKLLG